jgi:hypothetical protein
MIAAEYLDPAREARPGRAPRLSSTVSTVGPPTPNARIIFVKSAAAALGVDRVQLAVAVAEKELITTEW